MLIQDVERYLTIRRALGFKLKTVSYHLLAFSQVATSKGETHVRSTTAVEWAAEATTSNARHARLRDVVHFARFLRAEDSCHEVPQNPFHASHRRPLPYIFAPDEILRLLESTASLLETYPLRRPVYRTLLGLIAATGLRLSEALNLEFDDLQPGRILRVKKGKYGKERLIPLHPTVQTALECYLEVRQQVVTTDNHLFLSHHNKRLIKSAVWETFRRLVRQAEVAPNRVRPPRIHDLRHTFATRALERCPGEQGAISRHFIALSTYLGHVDIQSTYWYLEATPELMTDMAAAAETFIAGGRR